MINSIRGQKVDNAIKGTFERVDKSYAEVKAVQLKKQTTPKLGHQPKRFPIGISPSKNM